MQIYWGFEQTMINVIIILIVIVIAGFGVRDIIRGITGKDKCACTGDCSMCTIQCRSSEKYYGKKQQKTDDKSDRDHNDA